MHPACIATCVAVCVAAWLAACVAACVARRIYIHTYLSLFDLALLLPGICFCNPGIYVPVYLYGIGLFEFAACFSLCCHGFDSPA